jgi:hypothetical protein
MKAFSIQIEDINVEHTLPRLQRLESFPSSSIFTSPSWTGAWLKALPDTANTKAVTLYHNEQPVGATFCTFALKRRFLLPSKVICYINQFGNKCIDDLFIEFNEIVSNQTNRQSVYNEFIQHILETGLANEIVFPGITKSTLDLIEETTNSKGFALKVLQSMPYYYVDTSVSAVDSSLYNDSLSSNTRRQIQRSTHLYEERHGELQMTIPQNSTQALEYLSDLDGIHSQYWREKGEKGAFYSNRLKTFHQTLIRDSFDKGIIQLSKITAGDHLLGYLYNFKYDKKIYCYQSGFIYQDDNRLKPGLTAHNLAIQSAIHDGAIEYNFLAGEARYKKSLATHSGQMYWTKLSKG